jgi:hypothetical protein
MHTYVHNHARIAWLLSLPFEFTLQSRAMLGEFTPAYEGGDPMLAWYGRILCRSQPKVKRPWCFAFWSLPVALAGAPWDRRAVAVAVKLARASDATLPTRPSKPFQSRTNSVGGSSISLEHLRNPIHRRLPHQILASPHPPVLYLHRTPAKDSPRAHNDDRWRLCRPRLRRLLR